MKRVRLGKCKNPAAGFPAAGFLFWRRPTLAQPIVALPSGLQRLTSVFGMGTGGATALGSPERNGELRRSVLTTKCDGQRPPLHSTKNYWFSDVYIQEVGTQLLRLRFIRIISSLCAVASLLRRRVNKKENDQAERVISIT